MTNKEAVEVLRNMKSDFPLPKAAQTRRAQNDALDVAIEALKVEPREDAMLKEIATKLAEEIKSDLIITDFSGNTRTITAAKAAPNVPDVPPVYAVSADDVIENMESELELCNRVLDELDIVGTERAIRSRVAEMLREQIDFVKELPQVEPEPRKGKWIWNGDRCRCSECNYYRQLQILEPDNYCPHCGAKMEKENDKRNGNT